MDSVFTALDEFKPITLSQLNTQASLMDRVESKYLIHEKDIWALLKDLKENFYILEIDGNKMFSYDNVYMDTKEYDCYHDHHQKKHKRIKMRTRWYKESDLCYFEFKYKEWSVLHKYRYDIEKHQHGHLDATAYTFINDIYSSFFGKEFWKLVFPSIKTTYQRCTFCSKTSAEKITIDFNLAFHQIRWSDEIYNVPNLVIVEYKSEHKDSTTAQMIEDHKVTAVRSCTKYCLGNYFLWNVQERDRFLPTIKKVKSLMYWVEKWSKKWIKQINKFKTTQLKKKLTYV